MVRCFFSSFGFSFTWFCKNEKGRASYPPRDDSPTLQRLLRVTAADFSQPAQKCRGYYHCNLDFSFSCPFFCSELHSGGALKLFPEPGLRGSLSGCAVEGSVGVCLCTVTEKCVCERGGGVRACQRTDRKGKGAERICDPHCSVA